MLPFLRQLAHQVWLKGRRFWHNAPSLLQLLAGAATSQSVPTQAGVFVGEPGHPGRFRIDAPHEPSRPLFRLLKRSAAKQSDDLDSHEHQGCRRRPHRMDPAQLAKMQSDCAFHPRPRASAWRYRAPRMRAPEPRN